MGVTWVILEHINPGTLHKYWHNIKVDLFLFLLCNL
jgi:hypothetical protein